MLQLGAWAHMIVKYSQQSGLVSGISQTLDGEHLCPICKAIQKGKKQEEKKAPLLNSELKKDYLCSSSDFGVQPGYAEIIYPEFAEVLEGIAAEPPIPPPRS